MYENVIALCLKSDSQACIFDKCELFAECYPEEYEKLKGEKE